MAEKFTTAFIGLGSNQGRRRENLQRALVLLTENDCVKVEETSSFYETAPVGVTDQPDFINACAKLSTNLSPRDLMLFLLFVEKQMGRVRERRWGPRNIDLDLLLYGDRIIREKDLVVPHPEMHRRAFVLIPLAEIAPDAKHPKLGKNISELLEDLGDEGVKKLAPPPR